MVSLEHISNWNQIKQKKTESNMRNDSGQILEIFDGKNLYFAEFIPNLSEKTQHMRQLLKVEPNVNTRKKKSPISII